MNESLFAPIFILFFWLFPLQASAQYESVDAKVSQYPRNFTSSDQLAGRIMKDFPSDENRVRAAYTWVAKNIAYDLNELGRGSSIAYRYTSEEDRLRKERQFRDALIARTLRARKAVCEGYSSLMADLFLRFGLENQIVPGFSRNSPSQIGAMPRQSDHAWNAVKIDGEWKFIDATWGAGAVDVSTGRFKHDFSDAYFCPEPARFFMNHFPEDPKWLLAGQTMANFTSQPHYYSRFVGSAYTISPSNGVLTGANPIEFFIGNLNADDRISYIIGNQNTLRPVKVSNGRFFIPSEKKGTSTLIIFINEKPAVAYKWRASRA